MTGLVAHLENLEIEACFRFQGKIIEKSFILGKLRENTKESDSEHNPDVGKPSWSKQIVEMAFNNTDFEMYITAGYSNNL